METLLDTYIRSGYDLLIGVIDRGPNEGLFKACLENGEKTIETIGETPGEALKTLGVKLIQITKNR